MKLHLPRFIGYMFCDLSERGFRHSTVTITKISKRDYQWSNTYGDGEKNFKTYADCEASAQRAMLRSFYKLNERIKRDNPQ